MDDEYPPVGGKRCVGKFLTVLWRAQREIHRLARIICFRYESFVMNTTKLHK